MQVRKGKDRFAVLFPTVGLVFKFPRVHPELALRVMLMGRVKWLKYIWKPLSQPLYSNNNALEFLFSGIVANWSEFWFYLMTRNPFVQPTLFSLFGLVNVQRYGEPVMEAEGGNIWCQLVGLTNEAVWEDGHHFSNAANFCRVGGKLRMVDYASKKCQSVIRRFGAIISEKFDPAYRFEEREKKK